MSGTTYNNKKISLILAAAGSSSRMGMGCKKEYLPLQEGTVLSTALKQFLRALTLHSVAVTVPADDDGAARAALFKDAEIRDLLCGADVQFVLGGSTRQQSVCNALRALSADAPDVVLIHDGARPFVTQKIIAEAAEAALLYGAAVPGVPPVDTQKTLDESGFIREHLHRAAMTAVQTPQAFRFAKLLDAHKKAADDGAEYTDDTEIWGKYVGKVKVTTGDVCNKKITYADDYKAPLKGEAKQEDDMNLTNIRTGLGYDIHRLVEGRKLILGGGEFDFEKGEDGHSDGDALLHAITDALLGASGMGDIGSYFPPEEAKWKDADSAELLRTVWRDVQNAGWSLINLDCVVKLEKPKFLPQRTKVIDSIAAILGVQSGLVFVKAKTGEKLDSVGSGNAIEAFCTCLLGRS